MSAGAPEWLSLDEGETVEWVGEPELASKASEFVTGLVMLPLLGFGLLIILPAYLQVEHTDYVVTNQSLYAKSGILSTNIQSVELDKIQNTEYSQSFVEKQLGYGTVGISTAGGGGVELSFQAIGNAREVQETIRELSKQYRDTAATEAGEAAPADPMAELADELERTREALENVEAAVTRALEARRGSDDGDRAGEARSEPGAERAGSTAGDREPDGQDPRQDSRRSQQESQQSQRESRQGWGRPSDDAGGPSGDGERD